MHKKKEQQVPYNVHLACQYFRQLTSQKHPNKKLRWNIRSTYSSTFYHYHSKLEKKKEAAPHIISPIVNSNQHLKKRRTPKAINEKDAPQYAVQLRQAGSVKWAIGALINQSLHHPIQNPQSTIVSAQLNWKDLQELFSYYNIIPWFHVGLGKKSLNYSTNNSITQKSPSVK